ncbi:MAG: resolvase [Proteobacteria bacterium]|nr:resolvase [Verrucomicrobiota bacterium]NBU09057.1 resolvase [Pseudomonadota bacterium]
MKRLFVAYYRVSTNKQTDGYGMDAQRHAVKEFVKDKGELLAEYEEVESGANCDREQLAKAIALCRKRKATLLIAKLDRLARNAAFLLNLRDSGCDFLAVDMAGLDRFGVGIMALVAERERELIGERTRQGLAAARRQGVRLGNPNPANALKCALRAISAGADRYCENILPVVRQVQGAGVVTLQGIADVLNVRGFTSPRGSQFTPQTVRNLLARAARAGG